MRLRKKPLACLSSVTHMVSNCANPTCSVPLLVLNDGRLFQFEVRPKSSDSTVAAGLRKISHFWLCGQCSSTLTLGFDQLRGVVVQPLRAASLIFFPQKNWK